MFTKLYCGHLCKMWIVNQRSRLPEDEKDIMINNVCMIEMMEGVRDQAKLQPFSWFGVCTVVFVVFIIIIHIIHDPPKKTDASFLSDAGGLACSADILIKTNNNHFNTLPPPAAPSLSPMTFCIKLINTWSEISVRN